MPLLHKLPVLFALLAVVGAAFGLTLALDREDIRLDAPAARSGQTTGEVRLSVPPIGDFAHYYGTEKDSWRFLNPFVPYQERRQEQQELEREERAPPAKAPVLQPPPVDVAEVQVFEPPAPLKLPRLRPTDVSPPLVVGILDDGKQVPVLRVRGADGVVVDLRPGGEVDGWRLVGIQDGTAVFTDPDGHEHRLPVGDGGVGVMDIAGSGMPAGSAAPGGAANLAAIPGLDALRKTLEAHPQKDRLLRQYPQIQQALDGNPQPLIELLKQRPELMEEARRLMGGGMR